MNFSNLEIEPWQNRQAHFNYSFFIEHVQGIGDYFVGVNVFTRPSIGERVDLLALSMGLGRATENDERDQGCYAERGDEGSHQNGGSGAADANQWRGYGPN